MADIKSTHISTNTLVRGLFLIVVAYGVFLLREIIILILVAVVIASFVESGVRALHRFGMKRSLSVPLIYAIGVAGLFAVLYAFVPIVFRELSGVLGLISAYIPSTEGINQSSLKGAGSLVTNITSNMSTSEILANVKQITSSFSSGFTSIIGGTFGGLVNLILVIVMSFYLSIQEKGIVTFLRIVTPIKHEKYVIDLWARTQRKIGLWFQGQLFLGLVVGAITFIVLSILGVQYALLIAIVSGLAELVPFGLTFASIPAVLFALIDGGFLLGFKVLIFYIILQQLENYVLGPAIVKRVVGIPPLIVLVAFLVGITLAGFWGALLAIPFAVLILEYLSDVEKNKYIPVIEKEK